MGDKGLLGNMVELRRVNKLLSFCGIDNGDGGCGERLINVGDTSPWSDGGVGDDIDTD